VDALNAPEAETLFDPRGLVELDDSIPKIAQIDGDRAVVDGA